MKRYEKSIINSIACLAFIVFLSACGNNESTVNPTPTSVSDGISDLEKEIETENIQVAEKCRFRNETREKR